MATNARFLDLGREDIIRVGRFIRDFRSASGVTQEEFARACDKMTQRLFPQRHGKWDVRRISRIERAETKRTTTNLALERWELDVIAAVLGLTQDALLGYESPVGIAVYDPEMSDVDLQRVRAELDHFISNATEVHGWGMGLPPSMELPEFMEAHHTAKFGATAAQRWNQLGSDRRRALLEVGAEEKYALYNYIFLEDLSAIATGSGAYGGMPASLRRSQFDEVLRLLDMPYNVTLIVASKSEGAAGEFVWRKLLAHDTVAVIDKEVAMGRSHVGRTWRHLQHSQIYYWRGVFREFEDACIYDGKSELKELIQRLRTSTL